MPTYTETPVQSRPTPEITITAGLMVILLVTPAKTEKNLDPDMTREQQKLIQKGAPLDISPAENGWGLSISKTLKTQQHPSL